MEFLENRINVSQSKDDFDCAKEVEVSNLQE